MTRTLVLRLTFGALLIFSAIGLSVQLGSADVEVKDHKLRAFIEAALAVDGVMDKWQPKIIKARDSDETENLHVQANAEIRETIERADGISFDEYQRIRNAIAADPDMLDRVTDLMWEQQGR
ncbi:MAG: DUF4168 domain-containing protein [Geminicoccaceae bacterium]